MLTPIAASTEPCKCCGAVSGLYGVVDFNKNCEQHRRAVLPLSGIPIYYHRCGACGFIFTTAFDKWTPAEFLEHIYNPQYALVDPDYATIRPDGNAQMLAEQLLAGQKSLRILDYGGGNGRLIEQLRQRGFEHAQSYDPFVPESAQRPQGRFDCIVSFEVFEHSPDPKGTIGDILSMLDSTGIVVFSTLLQQAEEMNKVGVNWWYIAPRNGHVSIFSPPALQKLAQAMGLQVGSFSPGMHVLYREIPPFAKRWFGQPS